MNMFIIDDHPLTVDIYEDIILKELSHFNPAIVKSYTCKDAYCLIYKSKTKFDFAIVDYNLPPYPEEGINTGVDVITLIRKHSPHCKFLMITSHTEVLVIYSILRKLNPIGLATKNDISAENLAEIIGGINENNKYMSPNVENCVKKIWDSKILADNYNAQIILCLKKGYRIKDLHTQIPLSTSAISKRISKIKENFGIIDENELLKTLYFNEFI